MNQFVLLTQRKQNKLVQCVWRCCQYLTWHGSKENQLYGLLAVTMVSWHLLIRTVKPHLMWLQ